MFLISEFGIDTMRGKRAENIPVYTVKHLSKAETCGKRTGIYSKTLV
jgi:hypothetical protein